MTAGDLAIIVVAVLGSGGLGTFVKVIYDRRAGISSEERQARRDEAEDRRDTIADRDALIATMGVRLLQVEERLTAAEDGNVHKALTIRAQGDFIDSLEHHIYKQLPPPPPSRPPGV